MAAQQEFEHPGQWAMVLVEMNEAIRTALTALSCQNSGLTLPETGKWGLYSY